MTLPQVDVLAVFWISTPPPAVQLKRIAQALGLSDPVRATPRAVKPQDAMQEALAAGIPVMEGRPDDPMLDLLGL